MRRSCSLGGCLKSDFVCIRALLFLFSIKNEIKCIAYQIEEANKRNLTLSIGKELTPSSVVPYKLIQEVWKRNIFSKRKSKPSPFSKRAFSSAVSGTSGLTIAGPLFRGSRETMTNRALVTVFHCLLAMSSWSTSIVASMDDLPTHVTWPRNRISASN